MKTNIFDYVTKEATIADSTILENTGVSTENVLRIVHEKLLNDTNSKVIPMKSRRKTALRAAAFVAAAVLAITATAQAMGAFKDAFGGFFVGESPDGIYSGDNVVTESEHSNIEFLGIAGDKTTAAAAMRITKQDGSPYIDSTENTWIASSTSDDNTLQSGTIDADISYTTSVWSDITNRYPVYSEFGLYFEDNSTINAYIYSTSEDGGIVGETMTAKLTDISAYTVKEVLYDYSEHADENIDEEGFYINTDFNKALIEFSQKYGYEEHDGVILAINPETKDIVLAKETELDVDLSLSVKMNYKFSSRTVTANNLSSFGSDADTGTIYITPFSLSILADKTNTTYTTAHFNAPVSLIITLKDGSTVAAFNQAGVAGEEKYRFFTDNGDGSRHMPVSISPNDVTSVEADGIVIF